LSRALLFDPDVRTHYEPDQDALHVALYYETPLTRKKTAAWHAISRVRPTFASWQTEVPEEAYFLDVDPNNVGTLSEKTKYLFPPDTSVMKYVEYSAGGDTLDEKLAAIPKTRNYVQKEDVVYGMYADGTFWCVFDDRSRILVSQDVETAQYQITITMRNGLVVKQGVSGDCMQ
jgi:hypothetical protein